MIAEFAALAELALSAYQTQQNQNAAVTASGMAQDQQRAVQQQGEVAATQSFAGASYDEQWMQMKQLSQQLYGIKQTEPLGTPAPVAGPTLR
jgi:hypothetical protein